MLALFAAMLPGGVIVKPVANMYSTPTEDASVASQAIYGTNISVLEQRNGWARIRTPDNYAGWTPASSLLLRAPYAAGEGAAEVVNLFAHIYREPDVTKHAPVVTVPFETRLEVLNRKDVRWIEVRLPDARTGWIQSGDVSFAPRKLSIPELIDFSKRFLGLPYTWGGTSSYGYDCSGLTQMLYRQHGVAIPRDAAPQAAWSGFVPVERRDLEPGDLLFFGASPEKITHTGMYVGENHFINATPYLRPVVQICDLRDPHWTRLLVACRRLK